MSRAGHSEAPPAYARSRVRLWRLILRSAAAALMRVLWLLFVRPTELWFALSAPFRLARFRRVSSLSLALAPVSPGVWRVAREVGANPHDSGEPLVVLQYTGTGESVHAAYENLRRMFEATPALASATHYVFEAPLEKGAYYGPEAFSASIWQRVEPMVAHYPGPFVLVGVSRGALAALDHAMRIVEEHGKVASVLALSAPVTAPRRIPPVIATIAGFVESLEGLALGLSQVDCFVGREIERNVRFFYEALIALILRFHGVFSLASLQRHALDVRDHGVLGATLRASREFRLLVRASERKLQLHCQFVAQALAQHRQRFFGALVWGADDRWIDARACFGRLSDLLGSAPPESAALGLLPQQGHLVRAGDEAAERDYGPWFERVAAAAIRLSGADDPEAAAARRVENELHLASEARREHE